MECCIRLRTLCVVTKSRKVMHPGTHSKQASVRSARLAATHLDRLMAEGVDESRFLSGSFELIMDNEFCFKLCKNSKLGGRIL